MTSLEAIETTISFCSRHNYTHIVTLKQSTSVPRKNLIFKIKVPPWSWTFHVNLWWKNALHYSNTYFPVPKERSTLLNILTFYVLLLKDISYIHIYECTYILKKWKDRKHCWICLSCILWCWFICLASSNFSLIYLLAGF